MIRLLTLLAFLVASAACPALPRWDALPALDLTHVQGAYAGQSVCPMCRHGYDAGVLVFLPSTTAPDNAANIVRALHAGLQGSDHPRFRTFLVLTGSAPSAALLAVVRHDAPSWHVARMDQNATVEAGQAMHTQLSGQAIGYVFAQRRMLWSFVPRGDALSWNLALSLAAQEALAFLQQTYAQSVSSTDPDTPKGRLWLAPNALSSMVVINPSRAGSVALCLPESAGGDRADALFSLSVRTETRQQSWWARTDSSGCVALQGTDAKTDIEIEAFLSGAEVRLGLLRAASDTADWIDPYPALSGREAIAVPCDGCEAVFQNLPRTLRSHATLTASEEPGEPLLLHGVVADPSGRPQAGVIVYAYQTDAEGRYRPDPTLRGAAARHGALRAWARTDAHGRYAFHSIRPGAYPDSSEPAHIHLHVIEATQCTYYLGDVLFTDDPRLTDARRRTEANAIGGNGVIKPGGDAIVGWRMKRDIWLRRNLAASVGCG